MEANGNTMRMPDPAPDLVWCLTVEQVAARIARSRDEVERLRKTDPTFPAFFTLRQGGERVCYLAHLRAWIEARIGLSGAGAGGPSEAELAEEARQIVARGRRGFRRGA